MLTFNFFYLPLIRRKWYNKLELSELEKLFLVLTSERKGDYPELLEENSMLKEIQEEIEIAGFDEEVMGEYDKEVFQEFKQKWAIEEATARGLEEGKSKGLEQGLEQGRNEANIENAKRMLEDKIDVEKISKYTNLSIEQIKNLAK